MSATPARLACLLLAFLGFFPGPGAAWEPDPGEVADGELVLGRISDDPRRHHDPLRALLDYVVPRMRSVGIRRGRVLMARDFQQMASYLRRGRVDWVTETAATGLLLAERSGGQVLVGTERNGVAMYRSLIFARRDSGIRSLADLRGRSIAFQNPQSTSAFYAPAATLLDAGVELEILLSPKDRPRSDATGYVFAQSESNIGTWVHKRLVDAGAFSNLDWNDLGRLPESMRADLVVIAETPDFPRGLEIVGSGMTAARVERLREVLLGAAADPAAREALRRFFGTDGFFAIDEAQRAGLQRLRDSAQQVRSRVE
ncbi:phosphate/phosphite/phosphonate ABC transporter substrate-binding protein [Pseudomarimonas salicorniae]|uniref:Phosphate/phosphite/phosphonate ABC transporter substrate-binding protein n=1 Tax=Pseudomarimonas salicorniae TaxID=2933270 RepID=A0ABT0GDJ6_9GAMM|nr:phosphate/phosphite/phosphonate ABC transporter substrate-binding protein [Lysobacter sp. CAU 1642]MCK7592606.1 phosphate/phosphite/phosphonate ABC transporter substrate-binding protein [Lysobacter sp. CAU 1642]